MVRLYRTFSLYIVTGETRSAREQMVGLLHSAQHMMLGLIFCPDKVHPILLTKSANGLSLKHLAALQLNTQGLCRFEVLERPRLCRVLLH